MLRAVTVFATLLLLTGCFKAGDDGLDDGVGDTGTDVDTTDTATGDSDDTTAEETTDDTTTDDDVGDTTTDTTDTDTTDTDTTDTDSTETGDSLCEPSNPYCAGGSCPGNVLSTDIDNDGMPDVGWCLYECMGSDASGCPLLDGATIQCVDWSPRGDQACFPLCVLSMDTCPAGMNCIDAGIGMDQGICMGEIDG